MTARVSALQVAVAAAIACNGCIKIEKFRGADDAGVDLDGDGSGSDTDGSIGGGTVHADDSTGPVIVTVDGLYRMEFSEAGFKFPTGLFLGTEQVFAPTSSTCANELGVGVTVYPGGVFNGASSTAFEAPMTSSIKILQAGPAIAKIELVWSGSFSDLACPDNTTPRGRSTFTFFPNGRIQRMDFVKLDGQADASACGCTDDSQWELGTYYTFDENKIANFDGTVNNDPFPATNMIGSGVDLEPSTCWNTAATYQVAMTWRAHKRLRARRITTTSLAMIGHMLDESVDPLPEVATTAPLGDTSTTMFIANGSTCAALKPQLAPFGNLVDKHLVVNGVDIGGLGQDGLYGGETSGSLPTHSGHEPAASPIMITPKTGHGPIPAFGVWLDLHTQSKILMVSAPHTAQAFEDSFGNKNGQYLFWFPDGLSEGGEITITAEAEP